MANNSERRLEEIQQEMSRFEEEISGGNGPNDEAGGHTAPSNSTHMEPLKPPPHPIGLAPPPKPPAFLPPQLRARFPPPPPPGHFLHRPPSMIRHSAGGASGPPPPPPPPGHYSGPAPQPGGGPPNPGGPPPRHPGGPPPHPAGLPPRPMPPHNFAPMVPPQMYQAAPASFDRSRVVYSAPPVKLNKKGEEIPSNDKKQEAPKPKEESHVSSFQTDQSQDMELDEELTPAGGQHGKGKKGKKKKETRFVRTAAGHVWEDDTLKDWDPDDFRIFCGDLGNETNDEMLTRFFVKYPSFQKAKVIRDKRTQKTRGYGFASFKDPNDYMRAMREMNGRYIGNRPIKLRKSSWRDREVGNVVKKVVQKHRLGLR